MIIGLSKSDTIPPEKKGAVLNYFRENLSFAYYAPILFVSSVSGEGVEEILNLSIIVHNNRMRNIARKKILKSLKQAYVKMPPPLYGRKRAKILEVKYIKGGKIIIKTDIKKAFSASYLRYLKRHLYRDKIFDFTGIPLRLIVETKEKKNK